MKFAHPGMFAGSALLLATSLASAQNSPVTVRVETVDVQPRVVVQIPAKIDPNDPEPTPSPKPQAVRVPVVTAKNATGETIGLYVSPVPPAMASQLRLKPRSGLVVEGVIAGSPAEHAGIQQYDVISSIDGQTLLNAQSVEKIMSRHKPGEQVSVDLIREGRHQNVAVAIQPRSDEQFQYKVQKDINSNKGFGGFNFTPDDKQKLGEMSDRLRSEVEKQEKKIEELTARIRAEAEQAKKQIQELKDQIRREAQQEKDKMLKDQKDRNDQSDEKSENPKKF